MLKNPDYCPSSIQDIDDYGIKSHAINKIQNKLLKRTSRRSIKFSPKVPDSLQINSNASSSCLKKNQINKNRFHKKFVRSNSNSQSLRNHSGNIVSLRKSSLLNRSDNQEGLDSQKYFSEIKMEGKNQLANKIVEIKRQNGCIQRLKRENTNYMKQIQLLKVEIENRDKKCSDLQNKMLKLIEQNKIKQSKIDQLLQQNQRRHVQLNQNNQKLSNLETHIRESQQIIQKLTKKHNFIQESQNFSLNLNCNPQSNTHNIITTLNKTIQYHNIEISMLKRSQYEANQMRIEYLMLKKQNNLLRREINRLHNKNRDLQIKQRNKLKGQSQTSLFSLQISTESTDLKSQN